MKVSWQSVAFLLLLLLLVSTTANEWPNLRASWGFEIVKDANTVPPPLEEWDARWFHLHRNHEFLPDALVNTIAPRLISGYEIEENPTNIVNVEVRYVIRGVVVSDWIGPPFRFDLRVDGLDQLQDGVHAMTIEARGADLFSITPIPAFVHLTRENGASFGFDFTVPIITGFQKNPSTSFGYGPNIVYVDPNDRNHVAYPADSAVTPWSTPPTERSDLFQELMAPHTNLFEVIQMWWDHTAHQDAPFVRGMPPMQGEDHRSLRQDNHHEKLPMMDGPRGVGWMSAYVGGQVDSQGRFAFAEVGGRVGYLMPDGEIVTLAGWRVKPDKDPIWWEKPLEAVRANMENRGSWTGQGNKGEFHTPLDVAIDPQNENILYVAAYEDHVIWKIQVPQDFRRDEPVVSILAGSHIPGFADGNANNARFNGPASLVFDPVADVLYVADQDNNAIRRVTRGGIVSTVARSSNMEDRLVGLGVDPFDQLAARSVSNVEVGAGGTPDVYIPQTIRVDSQGRIILLEIGFGAIRRIHPATLETDILTEVQQKHEQWDRGWAWLDVDRYGNCGPVDGIYWTKFVNTLPGEFQSEVYKYLAPGATESVNLFSSPTGLYPDGVGPLGATNPPHYGWLVAVDPRGAVLLAGGGEHGLTRLRLRRDSDPIFSDDYWLGRNIYEAGVPTEWTGDSEYAARSIALQFGRDGHNMLGMMDAWGLFGASDDELLDAYDVNELVRSDSSALGELLAYLRPNTFGAIVTTPAPTPSPTPSAPFTAVCFSGDMVLQRRDSGPIKLSDVKLGDYVLDATGKYSQVYTFGHYHTEVEAEFLRFEPMGLELSKDHMVFIGESPIPALMVNIGDKLETTDGKLTTVTSITTVTRNGAFAPFTMSGTIAVNGYKASSYVSFQDSNVVVLLGGIETPLTYQTAAHWFQSFHRLMIRVNGGIITEGSYTDAGLSTWIVGPHTFMLWLQNQHGMVALLFWILALPLLFIVHCIDSVVSWFC